MAEAKESLAVLQTHYRAAPKAEANAWILFAEAMVLHFDDLKGEARDRLLRSQAIAAASDLARNDALASAWLALIEYGRNDFASMDRHLRRALRLTADDDHLVLSRALMVVGVALQFAGRPDVAEPWMQRCRRHNSELGDDATWSATLHNTAWARLIDLRQRRAEGQATDAHYNFTRMSIESAVAFDQMAKARSLQVLNEILLAQIRSLLGAHDEATESFARVLPDAASHGLRQWISILEADAAVSLLAVGKGDDASAMAQRAASSINSSGHPDDVASAHSRLAEFHLEVGDVSQSRTHLAAADSHWARHRDKQKQIIELLEREPLPGGQ